MDSEMENMEASATNSPIWEEIDRSECYLVCCMFEEAASLAFSVTKKLRSDGSADNVLVEKNELDDMLESAGMVLVQSLKGLGRTSEILDELKVLFGNVAAIPVQVFLTGTCFQITETSSSAVQKFLEDFLSKWNYVEDGYYLCLESGDVNMERYGNRLTLEVDKYLEIVELYITYLGNVKKDMDQAISWVGRASLPVEKQQELLRRLHSINSHKVTSSSQASLEGENSATLIEEKEYNGSPREPQVRYSAGAGNTAKDAILKFSGQGSQCFWWFRTITLKFGNIRLVVSNGNIFLTCLALIIYYIMRRKQVNLKRSLKKQVLSIKKALVDLWKLAFSYQVNPLAAVQPLPTSIQGRQ